MRVGVSDSPSFSAFVQNCLFMLPVQKQESPLRDSLSPPPSCGEHACRSLGSPLRRGDWRTTILCMRVSDVNRVGVLIIQFDIMYVSVSASILMHVFVS